MMLKLIETFFKSEDGATAIEYGLIAALISVALISGATSLGKNIDKNFQCAKNVTQGVFKDDGVGPCAQFESNG